MQVFLSHVTTEAPIALALKRAIEAAFVGEVSVFAASPTADIRPGRLWIAQLHRSFHLSTLPTDAFSQT